MSTKCKGSRKRNELALSKKASGLRLSLERSCKAEVINCYPSRWIQQYRRVPFSLHSSDDDDDDVDDERVGDGDVDDGDSDDDGVEKEGRGERI